MNLRFTSTGSYSQSRARTNAYTVTSGGKSLGLVRRLSNNKWCAMAEVDGRIVAVSKIDMKNRAEAGRWLADKVKEVLDAAK